MTEFRIRLGLPADLPVLRDLYRRASLSNSGNAAALLAHPEALILTEEGIGAGRSRVATRRGITSLALRPRFVQVGSWNSKTCSSTLIG